MRLALASVLYPVWMTTGLAPGSIYARSPWFSYPYAMVMLLVSEYLNRDTALDMIGPTLSMLAVMAVVKPRWGVGILLGFTVLNYINLLVAPVHRYFAIYVVVVYILRQVYTNTKDQE